MDDKANAFDLTFMRQAIALAYTQLGRTAPNPAVGCVLVKNDIVVSTGATGQGGHPHAEQIALELAGDKAQGSTAYVTLEPCHSRSSGAPGCSDRLINAGVARVVAASADPHPTAMDGFAKLKAAGIRVDIGLCRAEAFPLVEGFFKLLNTGRPLMVVDAAQQGYDAEFTMNAGESPGDAVLRLGREGLTRIRIPPSSPHLTLLRSHGLIDHDIS
tara:strand:- start:53 stop:697 length:645 start_codon:yes stop_codon:yes gene_type:complete